MRLDTVSPPGLTTPCLVISRSTRGKMKHKGRHRSLCIISPGRLVINISMKQVHLVNGTELETTEECGAYCSPIRRHLRPTFRRSFRESLSSSDLPRACGIIFVPLFRLHAFLTSSQLEKEGGRRGRGGGEEERTCRCVALRSERPGACRRCFRFISRCSRDRSLSRHSCGSTFDTCHEAAATSGVGADERSRREICFFQLFFFTLLHSILRFHVKHMR